MTTQKMRTISVENDIKKCPGLKMLYLEMLKDWMKGQNHLPPYDEDLMLLQFLRRCYPSIEKAKTKVDNYLTFRSQLHDLNIGQNTFHPELEDCFKNWQVIVLPKSIQHGYRVFIARLLTDDVSMFHPLSILKMSLCYMECFLKENGTIPGYVAIIDVSKGTVAHLSKCTVAVCKQMYHFVTKCCPVPIKGLYIVNAANLEETGMKVVKSLIRNKMISQIQVLPRGKTERLHDFLPREMLPEEYGGDAGSMETLQRDTFEMIKRGSSYISTLDRLKVNEKKRAEVKIDFGGIHGTDGSFRKLEVD